MVGGVETGSFKDDAYRLVKLAKRGFSTFGADLEWIFTELLMAIELHSTIVTAV